MKTFNRSDWEAALAEWAAGDFSDEWKPFRHAAAMRGMIYPPNGSKWDSWDDAVPTQRSVLIRAIRETPQMLMGIIGKSRSWSEVIDRLIRAIEELREESWRAEKLDIVDRAEDPTGPEATAALAAILARINDSAAR